MSERKGFLLRLPPELMEELNRWARDELRSVNAQIEYLLREAVRKNRRSAFPASVEGATDAPEPGTAAGDGTEAGESGG